MADTEYPEPRRPEKPDISGVEDLLPSAERIVERGGTRNNFLTTGYGVVEEGDDALLAVRSLHNDRIVEAITRALRGAGVSVDVVTVDIGPDQERTTTMDVDLAITEEPREEDAYSEFLGRFWWVEDLAEERGYDLLIETTAGPVPWGAHTTGEPYYHERIPWQSEEIFVSDATHYPQELLRTITEKTRGLIMQHGPGSEINITDPEGTDITFTLHEEYFRNDPAGTDIPEDVWEEYYDSAYEWPVRGLPYPDNHVAGKPWPPLLDVEDATGVIASTLGHHSKPYPRIELHVEDSKVTRIDGGGERGDRMRDLMDRTADIKYPDFPGPGLFWFFECSIGTNPKAFRPTKFTMKSEPGTLVERLRSGVIHLGTGTLSLTYSEDWARENEHPFGHVDQHLNFPTYEIDTGDETITVVDRGHLTVLDDPEVREVAAEYGDPDELLTEDWIPPLPGVNTEGDYEAYAAEPSAYLKDHEFHRT